MPLPAHVVFLHSGQVEAAIRSGSTPIEHVRVVAGAGWACIWLFLIAPSGEAALRAAFAVCRESLCEEVEFAGWPGEMQVFELDPRALNPYGPIV